MRNYSDYLARGAANYGAQFDPSELAPEFIPYYNSGERIRILTSYGESITGTVVATTGWRPCFLLMRRSNAHGSSDTLSSRDTVTHVQRGRHYVSVSR